MATHDYVIDNSTGSNVRSDINNVLQAILTNNSSSSAPSTTAAYMWWADTTNGILKIRNSSNNDWVELLQLDGTLTLEDGSVSTPGLAFRDDLNTGIFSSAADTFNVATAGVERMELGATTIFNEDGADVDFRIEGDTDANLFYVDAGNERIGIGTSSPSNKLDIHGGSSNTGIVVRSTDDKSQISFIDNNTTGVGSVVVGCTGDELFFASGSGGSEGVRLDGSSRFMINMSTSVTGGKFQVNNAFNTFFSASNDTQGCVLQLQKTRATSPGTYTIVQDGDKLGELQFKGATGSSAVIGANIQAIVNGTPGSGNDLPTDLAFRTMPDGSGSTQEAMRIRADGTLEVALNGAIAGFASSHISSGAPLKIYKSSSTTHAGLQLIWDHFNTNTGIKQKIQFTIGDDASSDGFNNAGYVAIEKVDSWQSSSGRSAALVFATTSAATEAEKMRLTGSGLMLLGSSSTNGLQTTSKLQVQGSTHSTAGAQILITANDDNPAFLNIGKSRSTGNAILGNNDDVGQISFFGNDGSGFHAMARIMCRCAGHDTSNDDLPASLNFATLTENTTTIRDRLQIDDEGILSTCSENHGLNVSTTVSAGTSKYNIRGHHSGTAGSTGSGTISFTVWSNGNVENTNNSYGQISDETLKQDIVDASSQWNDIKNITVRKFRFKNNPTGELQIGVVAQEVEKVSAGLVYETGEVGEEVKAVKYSVLYMKAIKALQEAITKIEVLETKVAALESA